MRQIITTYFVVVALLALGFFGVGALAKAAEQHDNSHQEHHAEFDVPTVTSTASAGCIRNA